MTWILDIIAIVFVLGFSLYGLIKGTYYMVIDTLLVIVCIAGAAVGAYFTIEYVLAEIGIMDGLQEIWLKILGNSKVPGGQESVESTAYSIGYALMFLVLFIIYDIVLHLIRKWLLKGSEKLRKKSGFVKGLDNFIAFLLNAVISCGIVLSLLAVCYAFKDSEYILCYTNEQIQASEVLSLVYEINPLNALFEGSPLIVSLNDFFSSLAG